MLRGILWNGDVFWKVGNGSKTVRETKRKASGKRWETLASSGRVSGSAVMEEHHRKRGP